MTEEMHKHGCYNKIELICQITLQTSPRDFESKNATYNQILKCMKNILGMLNSENYHVIELEDLGTVARGI